MSRSPVLVSVLALVSLCSASARGDSAPPVRETSAGVRFESGRMDAPPAGVTFTSGAILTDGRAPASPPVAVTFTAGARLENGPEARSEAPAEVQPVPATRAAEPGPPVALAATPVAEVSAPPSIPIAQPARAHVAHAESPRHADSAEPAVSVCVAPSVRHVALDGAGLRPTHLALAADDTRVVTLVAMARPAPARQVREGLVYPEGRLVVDDGGEVHVARTIGTEPDSAIAILANNRIAVVGYERLDRAAREAHAGRGIIVTVLDTNGRVVTAARRIEGSEGLHIDSAVVRHRDGFAVMLGRETVAEDGTHGPVRESLFVFDAGGALAGSPLNVTDEQSDDTLAAHRVGLASQVDGSIRMTWSIAAGPHIGVWTARLEDSRLSSPVRVFDRAAWGTEVSGDSTGVVFRSGGERGEPVGLFYRRFEAGARTVTLGAGWDPSVAVSRGWWLVAGVALQSADGTPVQSVVAAARAGEALHPIVAPEVGEAALADAVDQHMVGTRTGSALAWIDAGDGTTPRRLGLVRIACP